MGHIGMHLLIKTESMAAAVFFSKPITCWQRHRVFEFFVWLFSFIYFTGTWIIDIWISKMYMTWDIATKWAVWKLDILPKAVSPLILRYWEKFKNCIRYFHLPMSIRIQDFFLCWLIFRFNILCMYLKKDLIYI